MPATVTSGQHGDNNFEMSSGQDHDKGLKVDSSINVEDTEADEPTDGMKSTSGDQRNMQRMGKNQQLVRHFRVLSMASFVAIATAAWEIGLFNLTPGFTNGGLPGVVYSVLWNFIGFGPIYFSMAEMASMAPIAGAQYHWVSEFAPENLQRVLSYFTG